MDKAIELVREDMGSGPQNLTLGWGKGYNSAALWEAVRGLTWYTSQGMPPDGSEI